MHKYSDQMLTADEDIWRTIRVIHPSFAGVFADDKTANQCHGSTMLGYSRAHYQDRILSMQCFVRTEKQVINAKEVAWKSQDTIKKKAI